MDGALTVAMPSILRAWRKQGGDQCFLLVRSPGPAAEVADAVQVVTGAHLAAVRDLSRRHVREVAPDRFLVEARDTAAWFAGEQPDPAVLAAARSDFGAAILTPETFATEPPPPWW